MSPKRGVQLEELRQPVAYRFADSSGVAFNSIPGAVTGISKGIAALAADTVRYFPFLPERAFAFDQLTIRVQSAGAGSTTARLGIYNADTDWQPTSLLIDGGTVAVDSTGVKNLSVSETVLKAGRYLLAFNTDGTPTCDFIRGGLGGWGGISRSMGGSSMMVYRLQATQTLAAFPAAGDKWDGVETGNGFEYILFMRVSA